MKKFIFSIIILLFSLTGIAQTDTQEEKTTTQFKIGTFYVSNLNYYGRSDSLQSSGVFPLAEFWVNEKFYMNAAPVFVNNAVSNFEYAGTVATIGFQERSKNEKFFSHIYFIKPFYETGSKLPQSVLKAQVSTNFAYQNKIINLNAGTDLRFSDKVDYGLSAGIDHVFRKQLNDIMVLVLDPSAYVYAGTQQFTKTYYKKSNFLFFPGVEQQVNEDVSKLSVLSYEFSMPVILGINKFQLIINPAYVIPQNLVKIENRPDISERGKEMFYVTAGAKYIPFDVFNKMPLLFLKKDFGHHTSNTSSFNLFNRLYSYRAPVLQRLLAFVFALFVSESNAA